MKLQTKIPLEKQSKNPIDYKSNLLLIGSCFVENIGNKLDYFKFQNTQNPFGILFHPKAIENLITHAINEKVYSEEAVFFHNEQWHCYSTHSKLSNASKERLLDDLNRNIKSTNQQIQESTHVVITLGTAWVYRSVNTKEIVANCHKIPQKQFTKELLSVDEISKSIASIVSSIRSVNSKASIIFTVSPIRHIKDGFIENTWSKAHLISAIHQFINQKSSIVNRQSFYFPSYEIMMDELRDYRFYKDDMVHPSETAIIYIWEKFLKVWISNEALNVMEEIDTIQKGLQHKPFNPESEAHQRFLQNLEAKINKLQSQIPRLLF
ncbi:GSCFA domain-containing protein [Flavivirga spongiicola]|uniref:GSCFA domain-containing protein n=1 Tax=Flavivirga spongiicola TaxID=421621 RepID=A0ABU7XVB5_9FLAO|nr:GSCFA domain-containing protein [Flavivirga sp. MEBiC05379]MDO5979707.1 GSCFA domain-containing protein [Flavivirga sp. MEBiC05379]